MPIIIIPIILVLGYVVYRMYYVGQLQPGPHADILGTDSVSDNIYHQLLLNDEASTFNHDGILLCFEKINQHRLIKENGKPGFFSVEAQYSMFDLDLSSLEQKGLAEAKGLVESTLDDPKPIVLTHWIETTENDFSIRYNA